MEEHQRDLGRKLTKSRSEMISKYGKITEDNSTVHLTANIADPIFYLQLYAP